MTSQIPFKGRISKVAFAAAILCSTQLWVHALPVGGLVSAGVANITNNALQTSIQQSSQNAAINWQSFNLAAGEGVRVIQPNASSVLLNRVVGSQPSHIFGTLTANGQIFLINPNGLLFGPGSSVNTSGLVASTLNLSDADLLAGRHQFSGASSASVINQGTLNSEGGYVTLLGAKVDNQGTIQANGGRIELTAQSSNALMPSMVNNTGVLQAQTLENRNGMISLVAIGPNGTVNAGGTLDVSGLALGQSGGRLELLGQQVGLFAANIMASGDMAGGQVLIGGKTQGDQLSDSLTRAAYVSETSNIQADAVARGNGGTVIVQAKDITRVHGKISVRGGALGGNGGFIETSADHLNVSKLRIDSSAPKGKMGTWLIDPADVTISSAATTDEGLSTNIYAPVSGASVSNINVGELVVALNAANVMVSTVNTLASGTGQGDINVNAALTWTAPTTLTLSATRDVIVNQAVTGTDGSLVVNAGRNASVLAAVTTTTGNLEFTAIQDVNLGAATTITTGHLNAIAGRNINFSAASAITGGDMFLRADNDGTGPGAAGGTVNITCSVNCITLTNGVLGIRFNPASEASLPTELTAYATKLTGATHTLDAKAWMFAKGVDKPYDANTTANLVLAGGPSGASLVPGTAIFTSKDVATQRSINFSAYTSSGAGTDHLLWSPIGVAAGTGTTSANITAVPLTITASGDQKNVDSVPYTGGNGVTYSSFVGGETPADLSGTLVYGGTSQGAVIRGNYLIVPSGKTSQNYTITFASGTLSIDGTSLVITPSNVNKAFGQTASLTGFTVVGLVNGDTVSGISQSSSGTVATASVAGGPYAIVGSNATGSFVPGNYSISYVNGTLTVLPAPLSVTANNASKTYGQTASLPVTGFTSLGLLNGDTITQVVNTSAGSVATATVAASPYAIVPSAAEGTFVASNYSVTYLNGALTVLPANLTVMANDASKTYGQSLVLSSQSFTSSGLLNGDTIGSVLETSAGAAASASVASSPYVVTPSAAAGGFLPGNYNITYVNGQLVVVPAQLTITAHNANKVYGQAGPLSATAFNASGLVNGDTVTQVTNRSPGEIATSPVGGSPYPITPSNATGNFTPSNYQISYVNGVLTITPAVLTITANDAWKTYGQTLVLPGTSFAAEGLVGGDQVSHVVAVSLGQMATALPETSYPIVISQPTGIDFAASNYNISFVDGALSVIALPEVIPTGRPFDRQIQTVNERPLGSLVTPSVLDKPAQLTSLTPDVIVDPIRPVLPTSPLVPSVVLPTPISSVVSDERPLPQKPVLIRPRKQDRN